MSKRHSRTGAAIGTAWLLVAVVLASGGCQKMKLHNDDSGASIYWRSEFGMGSLKKSGPRNHYVAVAADRREQDAYAFRSGETANFRSSR